MRLLIATLFAVFALAHSGSPARAWDLRDWQCGSPGVSPDDEIAGCTKAIESGELDDHGKAAALTNRGRAYNNTDGVNRAIPDLDQAIALNPGLAVAYSNRCVSYNLKGDLERAFSDCNKAIELDPKLPNAYVTRCNAYVAKGEIDAALADCRKAIDLDPNVPDGYNNRGNVYMHKGDTDLAFADFNQAIAINKNDALAYRNLALIYDSRKDYANAITNLDRAIELKPDFALAYASRGDALLSIHEVDRALEDYNRAIAIEPKLGWMYHMRGIIYFVYKHDLDRAIADYTQAIELGPNLSLPYWARGIVQLTRGAFGAAIDDFSASLTSDPKNMDALFGLGVAKIGNGSIAAGNADIVTAKAVKPEVAGFFAMYHLKLNFVPDGQTNTGPDVLRTNATQQDRTDCQQTEDIARSVAGCNQIVHDAAQSDADRELGWWRLGRDHMAKNALKDAVNDFSEAIRLDPLKASAARVGRATAELRQGDRVAATVDYLLAKNFEPEKINGMMTTNAELKEVADAANQVFRH